MHEIKFGPSPVVPTGPANLPRRWDAGESLGVGGVYAEEKRAICGRIPSYLCDTCDYADCPCKIAHERYKNG